MKRWFAAIAALVIPAAALALPVPVASSGRIERLENFPSRYIEPRHVDVWLPAGYGGSDGKRYNVLYMQDGQMLFDADATWNRQAWEVDDAVTRLVAQGRIPDAIVVGIWNRPDYRYAEYYPEKFLARADPATRRDYVALAQKGKSLSDAYLRFLVRELKPAIDRRYATNAGREGTVIMGSSMGGLISLYALAEYPQVFGAAAGLSTHWVGKPTAWGLESVRNAALPLAALDYLQQHLPDAGSHRVYTDRGDDALDSLYAPAQAMVAELLRDKGYGAQGATGVFPGRGHNERDWAARLDGVLVFLMAPAAAAAQ